MEFSVIIPTRNRPGLLRLAVESVIGQDFNSFEVIVVNDGSDSQYDEAYSSLEKEFSGQLTLLHLERSMGGHGQSFVVNMGVLAAKGTYIAFLDDDDFWIDPSYLQTAYQNLRDAEADVYYTDQQAYQQGEPTGKTLWLAGLETAIKTKNSRLRQGAYQVSVADLIKHPGFCHLNTSIVSRELYLKIKGLDENIRYENDRDFYLRIIDNANKILYNPIETSRHNIPDPKRSDNFSTVVSDLEKMLFRLTILDKAVLFAKQPEIIAYANQYKNFTLKFIAEALAKQEKYKIAFYYAIQVIFSGFSLKWLIYCGFLWLKFWLPNVRAKNDESKN